MITIKRKLLCNDNLICEKGETYENCPKDCSLNSINNNKLKNNIGNINNTQENKDYKPSEELYWLLGIIIVLIIVMLIIFRRK